MTSASARIHVSYVAWCNGRLAVMKSIPVCASFLGSRFRTTPTTSPPSYVGPPTKGNLLSLSSHGAIGVGVGGEYVPEGEQLVGNSTSAVSFSLRVALMVCS